MRCGERQSIFTLASSIRVDLLGKAETRVARGTMYEILALFVQLLVPCRMTPGNMHAYVHERGRACIYNKHIHQGDVEEADSRCGCWYVATSIKNSTATSICLVGIIG